MCGPEVVPGASTYLAQCDKPKEPLRFLTSTSRDVHARRGIAPMHRFLRNLADTDATELRISSRELGAESDSGLANHLEGAQPLPVLPCLGSPCGLFLECFGFNPRLPQANSFGCCHVSAPASC